MGSCHIGPTSACISQSGSDGLIRAVADSLSGSCACVCARRVCVGVRCRSSTASRCVHASPPTGNAAHSVRRANGIAPDRVLPYGPVRAVMYGKRSGTWHLACFVRFRQETRQGAKAVWRTVVLCSEPETPEGATDTGEEVSVKIRLSCRSYKYDNLFNRDSPTLPYLDV